LPAAQLTRRWSFSWCAYDEEIEILKLLGCLDILSLDLHAGLDIIGRGLRFYYPHLGLPRYWRLRLVRPASSKTQQRIKEVPPRNTTLRHILFIQLYLFQCEMSLLYTRSSFHTPDREWQTHEKNFGAVNPDTLTSKNSLAIVWKGIGGGTKAIRLMEECVQASKRVLETDHPSIAKL